MLARVEPAIPRASTAELAGKEAFDRGLAALRAERVHEAVFELEDAVEQAPQMVDYATYLAWARFCAAEDKQEILAETLEACMFGIANAPSPIVGRFCLGRVERTLGHDRDALRHFQEVLAIDPDHAEAVAEIRALEALDG